jgi:hypothetical protein
MPGNGSGGRPGGVDLSMAEEHELLSRGVSRRSVLRGGAIGLSAAMLSPGLVSCSGGTRTAHHSGSTVPRGGLGTLPDSGAKSLFGRNGAPGGRHLSFGADPTTQMRVAWQVASPVDQPFIRVGSTAGNLGSAVPARLQPLRTNVADLGASYTQYYVQAELNGLSPDTSYVYAVGHRGFSNAQWLKASVGTFRTAPSITRAASPFTFTAFGDQGTSRNSRASMALVATQRPVFHLLAGDIAYADSDGRGLTPSSVKDGTHDVFKPLTWNRYLAEIDTVASHVPWMVAAGNHDMEAAYSPDGYGGLQDRFQFPGNGPRMCPSVYSFVYGNVGVVSLDTNDMSFEIKANLGYSGGAQTAWLRKELTSLRKNGRVDFIVVMFHHCAYCTGRTHGSEGGVRNDWVPIFDQHQVDLVINGHNHIYERTDPLRGGKATHTAPHGSTVRPRTDGTTYLTVGGGGRDVAHFPAPQSFAGHESKIDHIKTQVWNGVKSLEHQDVNWSRTRYRGFSLVAVDVRPALAGQVSTMTVRALAHDGQEIDRVEMQRIAGRRTT